MSSSALVVRNATAFKRAWIQSIIFSMTIPLMFLGAMGFGVGRLVGGKGTDLFGDAGYLVFFATGMLPASVVAAASFESTFSIMNKLNWGRTYESVIATPMGTWNIVLGELGWIACRLFMAGGGFLIAMIVFDVGRSPSSVLALISAVLTGLAVSSGAMCVVSRVKNENGLSNLQRFVITPMFLFSGVFFPLPGALRAIAHALPLYHGVQLSRGFILGTIGPLAAAGHALFLAGFAIAGSFFVKRGFDRKLLS